jgi:hypothetical protein
LNDRFDLEWKSLQLMRTGKEVVAMIVAMADDLSSHQHTFDESFTQFLRR